MADVDFLDIENGVLVLPIAFIHAVRRNSGAVESSEKRRGLELRRSCKAREMR